jgi:hypothetical protein
VQRPSYILGLPQPAFLANLLGYKEVPMNKKYIVRLTDEERAVCETTIKNEKGTSEKLRRATILLKAGAQGPAWNNQKISEAIGCSTRTVEKVRQAFVLKGCRQRDNVPFATSRPGVQTPGYRHVVAM